MKTTAFLSLITGLAIATVIGSVLAADDNVLAGPGRARTNRINGDSVFVGSLKARTLDSDNLPGGLSGGGVPGNPSHGIRSLVRHLKRQSSDSTLETGKAEDKDIAHPPHSLGTSGRGLSSDSVSGQRSH